MSRRAALLQRAAFARIVKLLMVNRRVGQRRREQQRNSPAPGTPYGVAARARKREHLQREQGAAQDARPRTPSSRDRPCCGAFALRYVGPGRCAERHAQRSAVYPHRVRQPPSPARLLWAEDLARGREGEEARALRVEHLGDWTCHAC